MVTIRNY